MAIRVLTRFIFHRFMSTSQRIPSCPNEKIRSLSRNPNAPIKASPEFVEKSHYRQLISLANLFQRYGFPASQLHDFLGKNRFLLNFSLVDVEKSLGILLSFKLWQKSLVSIICTCPGVLELGFLRKWEMGISELELSSVSSLMIQNVLEHSKKIHLEPADLHRSLRILKDMGYSDVTSARLFEEFPRGIMMKRHKLELELVRRIEFLKGIGILGNEIDQVFYLFPGILGVGVEDRLKPLYYEFKDLGFSEDEVRREVIKEPRILSMEAGELSRCLEMLWALKCRITIKEKILSKGPFRAGFEVKLRVDCLCRHGLIRREAFKVLEREPRSIIYQLVDIEKKIEFLVHKMGFSIGCLIEVPEYLGVNFEKQIIPRYNVIKYLRSKGGLGSEVGLKGLIKPSRLRFYNLYVKPYPECEKIFGRFSRDAEVKTRHLVGLWKLFKPPSYSQTNEDMRNIKLFMEFLV
ncbi:hypothetical protein HHK36_015487 [Tetracentron sinense]|uniref:Transcription termination factor MTERF15, mitochondrial n=1 Tax=Tetracentron sinense TaxID=13715 RepID=A0A835DCV6_TETSI|nr:hypothetical protein HHK36_015487 [Tetracentron sinense]